MGNKFSRPVRHHVRKQRQEPSQHRTLQSFQNNSVTTAHQLIHQLETLKEKLEIADCDNQKNKLNREIELIQSKLNKII